MTLRARLLVAAGVVLAVMVATGVLVVANQRHFLVEQVDDQLEAAAGPVGRLPPPGSQSRPPAPPPTSSSSSSSTAGAGAGTDSGALSALWVGAVYPDGTVEARIAPGLGPAAAPVVDPAVARAAASTGDAFTAPADDGSTSYRLIARPVDGATVAVIGLPLNTVEEATRQLVAALAIGGLVMVAFVGLLGWWVWRLGLRPIQRITAAAEAVRAGDRAHRVEEFPAGTEAGEMAAALNTMLDERQITEDGLRRFVGDASHELRSPLTTIGGYVELYQRGGLTEPGALDDAMRRIAAESSRMAGLVDDLLLLARLDQARPLAAEPVDVALVLRDAATDTAAVAPQRPVHLEVTEPLMVTGDEQRLRQVVTAVVGNALVHTPSEAALWLRGRPRPGGGAVVEIHDDGPGMTAEVAAHAFERFYRGDPSRARTRSGSGLGLAIVASIVQGHGGSVELDTAPGEGTTVRIALPAGEAAPPPSEPPPSEPPPSEPPPSEPPPSATARPDPATADPARPARSQQTDKERSANPKP